MKSLTPNISRRLAALHPDHKRIVRGAAWVSLFVMMGKLAGAAKEMAVAYHYGISGVVDAFQLALTVSTWLPGALMPVIAMVLIPVLVRLRQRDAADRTLFLEELNGSVLLLGVALILICVFLGPPVLAYMASGLSVETQRLAQQLTIGMAPLSLLILVIKVFAGRLQAQERQVNTLLESVPAAFICGFVLFWPFGPVSAPLLWGVLIGYIVQTVWLAWLAQRADGQSIRPRWSWRSPHWPEFYLAVGVMAIGQFVMSFITPLDQYFAARLGDSAIATLSYADRVVALMIGLGSMAVSRAILPVLSEIISMGSWERARGMALKWSVLMFLIGGAAAVVGWATAPWVIALLFQRGAFTAEDTVIVASVLRWNMVQIPFYFGGLVLVQLMAGRNRFGVMSIIAATNLLVKLCFNLALTPWMGIEGIALATGLMYAYSGCCFLGLTLWLGRRGAMA